MNEQEYLNRILELLKLDLGYLESLQANIIAAHSIIESERNIIMNISHDDIENIKKHITLH